MDGKSHRTIKTKLLHLLKKNEKLTFVCPKYLNAAQDLKQIKQMMKQSKEGAQTIV